MQINSNTYGISNVTCRCEFIDWIRNTFSGVYDNTCDTSVVVEVADLLFKAETYDFEEGDKPNAETLKNLLKEATEKELSYLLISA